MKSKSKYHAKRTKIGVEVFDSKKEAARWLVLLGLEKDKEIFNLKRQVKRVLIPRQVTKSGKILRPTEYISDFEYDTKNGEHIVEDVKSRATITPAYIIKKKLLYQVFGLEVKEVLSV